MTQLAFPTALHERAAEEALRFFEGRDGVHAVLVTASCARGVADRRSDLDMAVLVSPEVLEPLDREWAGFRAVSEPIGSLVESSVYAQLHLDLIDGIYEPTVWDDGGGPDDFELNIGNHVAYSAPIWTSGPAFAGLRELWLPFYDERLRTARLEMVREACLLDLEFIPFYVERQLSFQAFDRLYKAFREFLQALFISKRTYPVVYNKWIRQQVCELLREPDLYPQLPRVLEVARLEGDGILSNARHLRELVREWIVA
jgi:hypothetical protein